MFEPLRHHCVVVLEQDTFIRLVLVQPRKTHPCLTERLLMGRKESNQTNKHVFTRIVENGVDPAQLASRKPAVQDLHHFQNRIYPGLPC